MSINRLVAAVLAAVVGLGVATVVNTPAADAVTKPSKPRKARLTFEQQLMREVNRVPGARSAQWVVTDLSRFGVHGMVAIGSHDNKVYVDPRTPLRGLPYIVRHEYFHILQGRVYPYNALQDPLAHLGGTEVMADCGAKVLGARIGHYTRKCNRAQLDAARRILRGQPA